MLKEGARYWDGKGNHFIVLAIVEAEGNTWVHYREDKGLKAPLHECKEFSCYLESFEQRFSPIP